MNKSLSGGNASAFFVSAGVGRNAVSARPEEYLVADVVMQHADDGGTLAVGDGVKDLVHLARVADRHLQHENKKTLTLVRFT